MNLELFVSIERGEKYNKVCIRINKQLIREKSDLESD